MATVVENTSPVRPLAKRARPGAIAARVVMVAVAGVVIFVLFRRVDWISTKVYLGRLGVRAPLVLLPTLLVLLCDSFGWRRTFEHPGRLPLASLLRVRIATEAVAGSLPAGVAVAEPLRAIILERRFGLPITEGAANVVVSKLAMAISQGVFLVCGMSLAGSSGGILTSLRERRPGVGTLGVLAAVGFLVVMGGALLILVRGRILSRTLVGMRSLGGGRWHAPLARLESPLAKLDHGFAMLARVPKRQIAIALGAYFVGWLCVAFETWLILHLFAANVSFGATVSIEALVSVVRIGFFFLPGSLGAQEASYYGLLEVCGVPHAAAIAAAFVIAKRAKELAWIALGYLLLVGLPARIRDARLPRQAGTAPGRNREGDPPIQTRG
jgi:glycosyltransferase 2 family protein